MRQLITIVGLISILALLLTTTGCDNEEPEGCRASDTFSMIIVDENDTNLLDPLNPDNIIGKVDMQIICPDGKVIPMLWIPNEYTRPGTNLPASGDDDLDSFEYASSFNCLVVGYWNADNLWDASFIIRIPEFGIELNVVRNHKVNVFGTWNVNNTDCKPIIIDTESHIYVDYKLTLPINSSSPKD